MSDDIIEALKKARKKCASTVDKCTLSEIDSVIDQLEQESKKDNQKSNRLKLLSMTVKAIALIKLLVGLSPDD